MCWRLIFYKGSMLLPAPRLSPQDPRPPAPELPDQFVEEHVETPSHQEAPLPDTILGGRAVFGQLGIRLLAGTAGFFGSAPVTLISYTSGGQKLILK